MKKVGPGYRYPPITAESTLISRSPVTENAKETLTGHGMDGVSELTIYNQPVGENGKNGDPSYKKITPVKAPRPVAIRANVTFDWHADVISDKNCDFCRHV